MKKVALLQVAVICTVVFSGSTKDFPEGNFEDLWPKESLCKPSETQQPPNLLPQLQSHMKNVKIVCLYNSEYYYTENFPPDIINPNLCTHINYEFAFLDDSTFQITVGNPALDIQGEHRFYEKVTNLKKRDRKLKVYLALGGWSDSTEKYSILVADPTKRAAFISHAVSFLKDHNFDGLDVAWEYPNAWQGDIGKQPSDKDNFATLLEELRVAFDKSHLELSASVAANENEIEAAYDVPRISKVVDHINLMTYDLHGHWEGKTGHHSQFNASDDEKSSYWLKSVESWVKRGAPKNKVVIGLPAYGRTFKLKDPKKTGLGVEIDGAGDAGPITKEKGYMAFNEICYKLEHENWTEVEDEQVGTYAYMGDQWISYDSPFAIARKVTYAIKNGFGGVSLKDVTADDYNGCCFDKYKFPLLLTVVEKVIETYFSTHDF